MIVASRYAKSLLDLAVEQNQSDKVYQDILLIKHYYEASRELVLFLKSPIIKTDKKTEVLNNVFGKQLSATGMAFLTLVTKKKREGILPEICTSFIDAYNIHNGITSATIITAVKLDASSRKKVMDVLNSDAAGKTVLNEKTDAELIGGFILRVGDKQVDTSVARQLKNLKKNFNTNTLSIN